MHHGVTIQRLFFSTRITTNWTRIILNANSHEFFQHELPRIGHEFFKMLIATNFFNTNWTRIIITRKHSPFQASGRTRRDWLYVDLPLQQPRTLGSTCCKNVFPPFCSRLQAFYQASRFRLLVTRVACDDNSSKFFSSPSAYEFWNS